jgi:hypothetical protein
MKVYFLTQTRKRHDAQDDIITEETELKLFFLPATSQKSKQTNTHINCRKQWSSELALQALNPAVKAGMMQLASGNADLRNTSCTTGHWPFRKTITIILNLDLTADQQIILYDLSPFFRYLST